MGNTARRLRPHEAATFQPLRVKVHAVAAPPPQLDQSTAPATKDEHVAGERILVKTPLRHCGQSIHAFAHVGHSRGEPYPRACGQTDHRCASTSSTLRNASVSTPPRK